MCRLFAMFSSLTRRGWWSDVSSGAHSCCILSLPSNCLNSRFASFPGIWVVPVSSSISPSSQFCCCCKVFQHDYIKIMQFTCTLVSRDSVYCLLTFQHLPTQFSAAKWKTISSHTPPEGGVRTKKCYITFDTIFGRYLPRGTIIDGSRKCRMGAFCTIAKNSGEMLKKGLKTGQNGVNFFSALTHIE